MKFNQQTIKTILISAISLTTFAVLGSILVGETFLHTKDTIAHNEKLTLLRQLNTLIPADAYDNDLLLDTLTLAPNFLLGTNKPRLAYRARKNNQPVAIIFSSIAPDGYNGPIELLIGIYTDGRIAGVRVVKHRETPGLGDKVEIKRSNWVLGFNNKSLTTPDKKGWKVKRDGGVFDQFTGATITPRAIVKAIHSALNYFKDNQKTLFEKTNTKTAINK